MRAAGINSKNRDRRNATGRREGSDAAMVATRGPEAAGSGNNGDTVCRQPPLRTHTTSNRYRFPNTSTTYMLSYADFPLGSRNRRCFYGAGGDHLGPAETPCSECKPCRRGRSTAPPLCLSPCLRFCRWKAHGKMTTPPPTAARANGQTVVVSVRRRTQGGVGRPRRAPCHLVGARIIVELGLLYVLRATKYYCWFFA